MIDLDRLEVLLGAATPGPWQAFIGGEAPQLIYPGVVCFACSPETKAYVVVVGGEIREHVANAQFVAAAHEELPAILAELRAAREEIGKLRVDLTELEMWRAIQCATIRLADAVPGDGATEET